MTVDFSTVAKEYHRLGLNQQSAGIKLIEQIDWQGDENIIDIGCGDGRLTGVMANLVSGEVTGVDISAGMIQTASKRLPQGDFIEGNVETLNLELLNKFDVIYINSVMHWFKKPSETLKNIQQLMNRKSCLAIQTPLKEWCPPLQVVIERTIASEPLKAIYNRYCCPWFHFAAVDEYVTLFTNLGYTVEYAEKDSLITNLASPLKLWDLFLSGPAQAYFNQENFSSDIPANLEIIFKDVFCSLAEGMSIYQAEYNRAFFKLNISVANEC